MGCFCAHITAQIDRPQPRHRHQSEEH